MKNWIYSKLVMEIPEIRKGYPEKRRKGRCTAILWAIRMNIRYYIMFQRGFALQEKRLYSQGSESARLQFETPERLVKKLMKYDVISFDVFDTLLFRTFAKPEDLFYFVGAELSYPDFKRIRVKTEILARQKKQRQQGTGEVTFREIWEEMEQATGIPYKKGMEAEWIWEQRCCHANPYMLSVVQSLRKQGKKMAVVSDMYLGKERIRMLLEQCGYGKFDAYFVSGDDRSSKCEGGLYRKLKSTLGENRSYVHVGDHPYSDIIQAEKHGMAAILYPNACQEGMIYRTEDMSEVTGSIYRAIVNEKLYAGSESYPEAYEYGFIYGGIFAVGYCRFIHSFVQQHRMDRLLFLARDGAVLKAVYQKLYPEDTEKTAYVYWSRPASLKLAAGCCRYEYFQRFLYHKAGHGYTVGQALQAMELSHMQQEICLHGISGPYEKLTHKNVETVKNYITAHWEQVTECYKEQQEAAKLYFEEILCGCERAVAVDVGWAGSGVILLDKLIREVWKLDCELSGILAGTTEAGSAEQDFGEEYFLRNRLTSYLFSQRENRELWKFHNAAKFHNLYWELLLGNTEGSLIGFYPDPQKGYQIRLKEPPKDGAWIENVHRGIMDFAGRLQEVERRLGQQIFISGRDAYAPMLLVEGTKNKMYRKILKDHLDEIQVG